MDTMAIRRQLLHLACRPVGPSSNVEWVQVLEGSPVEVPVLTSSAREPDDRLLGVPGDVSDITVRRLRSPEVEDVLRTFGLGVLAWCTWGKWDAPLAPGDSRGMIEADGVDIPGAFARLAAATARIPHLDPRRLGGSITYIREDPPRTGDSESNANVFWTGRDGQRGWIEADPAGGWEPALARAVTLARRLDAVTHTIAHMRDDEGAGGPMTIHSTVPNTLLWWDDLRDLVVDS